MKLYHRPPPKPRPARETHASIRAQTDAYLQDGGVIHQIPTGYTGEMQIAGPEQLNRFGLQRPKPRVSARYRPTAGPTGVPAASVKGN